MYHFRAHNHMYFKGLRFRVFFYYFIFSCKAVHQTIPELLAMCLYQISHRTVAQLRVSMVAHAQLSTVNAFACKYR